MATNQLAHPLTHRHNKGVRSGPFGKRLLQLLITQLRLVQIGLQLPIVTGDHDKPLVPGTLFDVENSGNGGFIIGIASQTINSFGGICYDPSIQKQLLTPGGEQVQH